MEDKLLVEFGKVIRAVDDMGKSVDSLSAQQELTRVAVEAQGQRVASLPCNFHQHTLQSVSKKVSDLYKRVGAEEEHTNRFVIEQQVKQDTRKFWKWAVGAAVALIAAALPFIIGWASGGK